jgi:probable addiction module antidote protein
MNARVELQRLNEALQAVDTRLVREVLRELIEARGVNKSDMARELGMTRMGLRKALAPSGNPSLSTVNKIIHYLGFKFTLVI